MSDLYVSHGNGFVHSFVIRANRLARTFQDDWPHDEAQVANLILIFINKIANDNQLRLARLAKSQNLNPTDLAIMVEM